MTGSPGILRRTAVLVLLLSSALPTAAADLNQGLSAGSLAELLPWAQYEAAVPDQLTATGRSSCSPTTRPTVVGWSRANAC